jgi:hypothetical protein
MLLQGAAARAVDVHELTKAFFLDDHTKRHERLAQLLGEEYRRNYRRTRFKRDDVI